MPKCPKCANNSFKLKEIDIKNEEHRHKAVVCSSCGTIVAVVPSVDTNALIRDFALRHGFNLG